MHHLRFADADSLAKALGVIKPVTSRQPNPGHVSTYVLLQQEQQFETSLTYWEYSVGYYRSRLLHNESNAREGGPAGQAYLLEYASTAAAIKRLGRQPAIFDVSKNGLKVTDRETKQQKSYVSFPLTQYPGANTDFGPLPTLPTLTCRVNLAAWKQVSTPLKSFMALDTSADRQVVTTHPLLWAHRDGLLEIVAFSAKQKSHDVLVRFLLPAEGEWDAPKQLVCLTPNIINKLAQAKTGAFLEYGYSDADQFSDNQEDRAERFGFRSDDIEVCVGQQIAHDLVVQYFGSGQWWDSMKRMFAKAVDPNELLIRVGSMKGATGVSGRLAVFEELDEGDTTPSALRIRPLEDISGSSEASVAYQPGLTTVGWRSLSIAQESLELACRLLAALANKYPRDQRPNLLIQITEAANQAKLCYLEVSLICPNGQYAAQLFCRATPLEEHADYVETSE